VSSGCGCQETASIPAWRAEAENVNSSHGQTKSCLPTWIRCAAAKLLYRARILPNLYLKGNGLEFQMDIARTEDEKGIGRDVGRNVRREAANLKACNRWNYNVKKYLMEIQWKEVALIHLAQNRNQTAFGKTVMSLPVPQTAERLPAFQEGMCSKISVISHAILCWPICLFALYLKTPSAAQIIWSS
jgi:hypothetical protein